MNDAPDFLAIPAIVIALPYVLGLPIAIAWIGSAWAVQQLTGWPGLYPPELRGDVP